VTSSPLGKLAFLVVDDNANMVKIVKAVLKSFGVNHIYDACGVAEGLSLVRQYAIDIVILDYNLGFMDGIDFIQLVRTAEDSPEPCMPIIMLTAYTEQHRVRAARDAGVTEFCCKPVTAAELYRKIAKVIEQPRDFVRSNDYFGPDRRRHDDAAYDGEERRARARRNKPPPETALSTAKAG
jgi:two-component system chemotaxis response regulator CheY